MTKQELKRAVRGRNHDAVREFARKKGRSLSVLYAMTFDDDPLQVRRAVEAVGVAAATKAAENLEKVRDFLRRCIWLMNDESGGIGWHSPEVMGEVLFRVPELIPEYGALLFHYFKESPFEQGAVAAVHRIAPIAPDLVSTHLDRLHEMLDHPDASIRANAILIYPILDREIPARFRERLEKDFNVAWLYDYEKSAFEQRTVQSLMARTV